MYEYIKGVLVDITPTYAIIENQGIAYRIEISLNTYSKIQSFKDQVVKLFIYFLVREDQHQLYGFFDKQERGLFQLLISVSGIGANIARTMLSASNPQELEQYILTSNISALKSIKGIGQKTAERLVVELRDKITKSDTSTEIFTNTHNIIKEEALSALIMLGYPKSMAEKVITKILSQHPLMTTEELIKQALKLL